MRYEENSPEVKKAKEIGDAQFTKMGETGVDNSEIYFMDCDITICNPFMDSTGRFELTLAQAYDEYGEDNVNGFIAACNK